MGFRAQIAPLATSCGRLTKRGHLWDKHASSDYTTERNRAVRRTAVIRTITSGEAAPPVSRSRRCRRQRLERTSKERSSLDKQDDEQGGSNVGGDTRSRADEFVRSVGPHSPSREEQYTRFCSSVPPKCEALWADTKSARRVAPQQFSREKSYRR